MSAQSPVLLASVPQLRLEQVDDARFVVRAKGRPGDNLVAGCFFVPMVIAALGFGGLVVAAWWHVLSDGVEQAIVATVVFGFMAHLAGVPAYYSLRGMLSSSHDRVVEIDVQQRFVRISQGRWYSTKIPSNKVTGVLWGISRGRGESAEFLSLQCGKPQFLVFSRPHIEYRHSQRKEQLQAIGETLAAILEVPFSEKGDMLWVENPW